MTHQKIINTLNTLSEQESMEIERWQRKRDKQITIGAVLVVVSLISMLAPSIGLKVAVFLVGVTAAFIVGVGLLVSNL